MSVKLINQSKMYMGLSTDSKPTDSSTDQGDRFLEEDTLTEYIYNGSNWKEFNRNINVIGNNIGDTIDCDSKTITTSSVKYFDANDRVFLALTNVNEYDVWVGLGIPAIVGKGIVLGAYGGNLVFGRDSVYKGAIYMIADGGSNNIAYVEGVY